MKYLRDNRLFKNTVTKVGIRGAFATGLISSMNYLF